MFRTEDEALIGDILESQVRVVDPEEHDGLVHFRVVHNLPDEL